MGFWVGTVQSKLLLVAAYCMMELPLLYIPPFRRPGMLGSSRMAYCSSRSPGAPSHKPTAGGPHGNPKFQARPRSDCLFLGLEHERE